VMRQCYEELQRPPGTPLQTINDAFMPITFNVLVEKVGDRWVNWPVYFPTNDKCPGDADELPNLWDYLSMTVQWLHEILVSTNLEGLPAAGGHASPEWWMEMAAELAVEFGGAALSFGAHLLYAAGKLARMLPGDARDHTAEHRDHHDSIVWLIQEFKDWLWPRVEPVIDTDADKRRLWTMVDIVGTAIIGMIEDEVVTKGFEVINHLDVVEWLRIHGAKEVSLTSAWVRGGYDFAFAYQDGDKKTPRFEAGTAVRAGFRAFLTYKGAVMWEMQSGMGEVAFVPLYQVLQKRGVKFNFFHQVMNLGVAGTGKNAFIDTITIRRQVDLKVGEYNPLVLVKGGAAWPSEPLYQQIVNGDTLKTSGVNLESPSSQWQTTGDNTFVLKYGEDFDTVVLGISLGALEPICKQLQTANKAWADMLKNVKTVQTQAVQLWLKPTLRDLGWALNSPILGAYVEPLDTWAAMDHLIARENWPIELYPGDIAYFCGPLNSKLTKKIKVPKDQFVKDYLIGFLRNHIGYLLPNATVNPDNPVDGFDWDLLVDPDNGDGADRLKSQYWRANTEGSELYVLSLPGTGKFRLKSDQSGFTNLYLAGDWTDNGINIGCIEGATLSGLQAARGIIGHDRLYPGETDFKPVRAPGSIAHQAV
jgi:uncharacterized protein with NAD-binding domain and iron-sulfur cluster